MLLRQIEVPADRERFGDYLDFGALAADSYACHEDLPWGFWVYVAPYWYIFRDDRPLGLVRPHGPERATGPPDVEEAGDNQAAWAQAAETSGHEWLLLEYDEPVEATEIRIHETLRPGAITRVAIYLLDGSERTVYSNDEPGPVAEPMRVLSVPLPLGFVVVRVKIEQDTRAVESYNEIDAVGLVDNTGRTHWADAGHASSSYGQPPRRVPDHVRRRGPTTPLDVRLDRLEQDVREVKQGMADVRRLLEELLRRQ